MSTRMIGQEQPDYRSRARFLAVAARVKRRILVGYARVSARRPMLLALDDGLRTIEQQDALKARLIEMRFFGGLTAGELAFVLNLRVRDVRRELLVARVWLYREMNHSTADGG